MSWVSLTRCNQEKIPKLTEGETNFVRPSRSPCKKNYIIIGYTCNGSAPLGETPEPGKEVEETMCELQYLLSEGI